MLAQAKSGTGKTAVFAVLALELLRAELRAPQVLILSPTRELAQQSHAVVTNLAVHMPGVRALLVVGGVGSARDDAAAARVAQILVGTPGTVYGALTLALPLALVYPWPWFGPVPGLALSLVWPWFGPGPGPGPGPVFFLIPALALSSSSSPFWPCRLPHPRPGPRPSVRPIPGRLHHMLHQEKVPLDHLRLFVLDEADRLLQGAFVEQVQYGRQAHACTHPAPSSRMLTGSLPNNVVVVGPA